MFGKTQIHLNSNIFDAIAIVVAKFHIALIRR